MNSASDPPVVNKISVSNDTEHIYRAIEALGTNVNTRFDAVDARFDRIEQEFKDKVTKDTFDSEIKRLDRENQILSRELERSELDAKKREQTSRDESLAKQNAFRWRVGVIVSILAVVLSTSVTLIVSALNGS